MLHSASKGIAVAVTRFVPVCKVITADHVPLGYNVAVCCAAPFTLTNTPDVAAAPHATVQVTVTVCVVNTDSLIGDDIVILPKGASQVAAG